MTAKVPRIQRNCVACGKPFLVTQWDIDNRPTKYCSQSCRSTICSKRHGHTCGKATSRTYQTWKNMMRRCLTPTNTNYHRYGGAGIKICERWQIFDNFLSDMGERPDGTTLDRYPDKNGDYMPGNCRWATPKEQARNVSSNREVVYKGNKYIVAELAEEFGIGGQVLTRRIERGWPEEEWGRPSCRKVRIMNK